MAPSRNRRPPRAAVPGSVLEIIRCGAGDDIDVDLVAFGDGLELDAVDFIVPTGAEPGVLDQLPGLSDLSVVQVMSAGTDWIEGHVPPQATLCNARGARDDPVAEWALGALLGASSGVLEGAGATHWDEAAVIDDLGAWTVVIVGMGSIGRRLGDYLAPLGTRVIGVGSRARDDLHGPDELPELLGDADAVVVLAPLTQSTRGLIDAGALGAMRDGAVLVNGGRGAVVDTDALVAELASGRLRAVLDVVDPEPLPDGHPLWRAPGLLSMTPHIAGDSPRGNLRAAQLAGEQLGRWVRGQPLHNVVLD